MPGEIEDPADFYAASYQAGVLIPPAAAGLVLAVPAALGGMFAICHGVGGIVSSLLEIAGVMEVGVLLHRWAHFVLGGAD